MPTRTICKNLVFLIFCAWIAVVISGCSDANSINSLNPTAANPESTINLADSPDSKTVATKPVVNIFSSSTVVGPQAEISLRAEAIDPLGKAVSLAWEATEGNIISTEGSVAVWKAPQNTAKATISCIASDVRGGKSQAEIEIDVIGNSVYRLQVKADRSSIITGRFTDNTQSPLISIPGASVEIKALGATEITNNSGIVEFNVEQSGDVATASMVTVRYHDWEVNYQATLTSTNNLQILDNITFLPGYDSVTVAIARGDSFAVKRGMIEVAAVENSAGSIAPVAEVNVNVGSSSGISTKVDGRAILSAGFLSTSETSLSISRSGYHNIEGYNVPVAIDGLTLVRAKLERTGSFSQQDAIISWTSPFNQQSSFAVSAPLQIGFGQPMEKNTLFNDISITVQNKRTGKMTSYSGNEISRDFTLEWKDSTVLKLIPKIPLDPETRYSIMLAKWVARAADGRMLKTYNGLYYEFTTDSDPYPKMTSTSPGNGATDVGRNGPFAIKFDRPMKPDSLYDDLEIEITSLDDGARLKIKETGLKSFFSVTWTENNTKLELVPFMMLKPEASYLVKFIRCNLTSESGKKASGFDSLWGQFKTGQL